MFNLLALSARTEQVILITATCVLTVVLFFLLVYRKRKQIQAKHNTPVQPVQKADDTVAKEVEVDKDSPFAATELNTVEVPSIEDLTEPQAQEAAPETEQQPQFTPVSPMQDLEQKDQPSIDQDNLDNLIRADKQKAKEEKKAEKERQKQLRKEAKKKKQSSDDIINNIFDQLEEQARLYEQDNFGGNPELQIPDVDNFGNEE